MRQDSEILQAMTNCLASYGKHLARTMGGAVLEWNDVVLCNPGFASKSKNMIVPLRTLSGAESLELASIVRDFYDKPDGWVLWSIPDQDHLFDGGFSQYPSINPAMTLGDNAVIGSSVLDGLTFEEVQDENGVLLFEQVREVARGNEFPATPEPGAYLDGRTLDPSHRLWIGYLFGEPVATGAVFENGDVSMVKNVAVIPECRGKGLGKAMSVFVTQAARSIPVLDADDGAPQLYGKLGFHEIGALRFWKLTNQESQSPQSDQVD